MKTKLRPPLGVPPCLWICRRYLKPEKAEAWMEVHASLWPERLIWTQTIGRPRVSLDFYAQTESEARKFAKDHGGRVVSLLPEAWWRPDRKDAAPLRFGKRLWIVATAGQADYWRSRHPDKMILIITNAMAFGTGQHETTAMCLRALLWGSNQKPRPIWQTRTCLDIGTGSGILALAAEAIGFKTAIGIDHDPTAIRVAREHGKVNKSAVKFIQVDLSRWHPPKKGDLVVANLFSEVLIHSASRIMAMLAPEGFLILSGIRKDQERQVCAAYPSLAFIKRLQKGNWICLVAQRKSRRKSF